MALATPLPHLTYSTLIMHPTCHDPPPQPPPAVPTSPGFRQRPQTSPPVFAFAGPDKVAATGSLGATTPTATTSTAASKDVTSSGSGTGLAQGSMGPESPKHVAPEAVDGEAGASDPELAAVIVGAQGLDVSARERCCLDPQVRNIIRRWWHFMTRRSGKRFITRQRYIEVNSRITRLLCPSLVSKRTP